MRDISDEEFRDLMTYGRCWCGRARRSVLTTEDGVYDRPGVTTKLSLVCYAGHDADSPEGGSAVDMIVKYNGVDTHYVLASRLREAAEEIRATREMMRGAERDRDDLRARLREVEEHIKRQGGWGIYMTINRLMAERDRLREDNERMRKAGATYVVRLGKHHANVWKHCAICGALEGSSDE